MDVMTYRMKKEGHPNVIIAVVRDGDSQMVSFSRCSRLDMFNRSIGREIAIGRATAIFRKKVMKPGWYGKVVALPFPYEGKDPIVFKAGFRTITVPHWLLTPKKEKGLDSSTRLEQLPVEEKVAGSNPAQAAKQLGSDSGSDLASKAE